MAGTEAQSGYAPVGDLSMYYEISGDGRPTILLHGAYQTIDTIGPLLPGLGETRKVIAVEQQGHGRTADIDRPLTYEQMADDTAAAVRHLGIDAADLVGYSMGGAIALQVAIRHPALVRKARRRVRDVQERRHARRGARHVPLDHARALRRDPDRGRVPPDRAQARRLPEAGREAHATRHDGLRRPGRSPPPFALPRSPRPR